MVNNYALQYNVDIVFCIDCTESMDNVLNIIKQRALVFHNDLLYQMQQKQKTINDLRVRVVAFRDYVAYAEERKAGHKGNYPMLVTDFFRLPEDGVKLELAVKSLHPVGGGDDPEDGLEALAYAIRSDWDRTRQVKHRHVIVLWSDAAPHQLGFGGHSGVYPKGMAKDIRDLTAWWGNEYDHGYTDQNAKRLILFTPDEGDWAFISNQWDNVIHYPSEAGRGLNDLDYSTILNCISQSI